MPRYHFDLGNSARGPVGYCAAVRAVSREAAAATLRRVLPDSVRLRTTDPDVEYVEIYFNPDRPAARDGARDD